MVFYLKGQRRLILLPQPSFQPYFTPHNSPPRMHFWTHSEKKVFPIHFLFSLSFFLSLFRGTPLTSLRAFEWWMGRNEASSGFFHAICCEVNIASWLLRPYYYYTEVMWTRPSFNRPLWKKGDLCTFLETSTFSRGRSLFIYFICFVRMHRINILLSDSKKGPKMRLFSLFNILAIVRNLAKKNRGDYIKDGQSAGQAKLVRTRSELNWA